MIKENNGQQNTQEETDEQETEAQESDSQEETEETGEMEDTGGLGSFFSPEAIIMMPLAILLDLIGLILVIFALDDFFITDIIGITIIGSWTFFRSQQVQMTQRAQQRIGKAAKQARRLKWLRPLMIIGEFIPYVGVLPCWTVLVYFELKA